MAFFEDLARGNVMTGLAVGALALALPAMVPALRSPMRAALKLGLTLYLEAEWELEGEVVDELVEATMSSLGAITAQPGWKDEDRRQAQTAVRQFKAKARAHAHRRGADDKDRARRYRRHLDGLRHAVSQARRSGPAPAQTGWARVYDLVVEDW